MGNAGGERLLESRGDLLRDRIKERRQRGTVAGESHELVDRLLRQRIERAEDLGGSSLVAGRRQDKLACFGVDKLQSHLLAFGDDSNAVGRQLAEKPAELIDQRFQAIPHRERRIGQRLARGFALGQSQLQRLELADDLGGRCTVGTAHARYRGLLAIEEPIPESLRGLVDLGLASVGLHSSSLTVDHP